jgi:putative peptide zinc metalloprotease protein
MSRPLLSGDWFRIGTLRPRLRGHAQVHRHVYRGEVAYVMEDRAGGKHQRFGAATWRVLSLLDGQRSLDEVWARLEATLDDDTPTQDDIVRLLGQLHAADLIACDITPDVAELLERYGKEQRRKWMGRVGNPVALRIPLFDPDPLLRVLLRLLRPLLGWGGVALWLAAVLPALLLLPTHWGALTAMGSERLLSADSLLAWALLFPLVKVVHELSHGIVCRLRGGEVHEMGVMLLVFYPVPYVDASAASAFASKWQRALVGAAGMLGEIFVAALAFYLWLALEPGLGRALAWDVMVLAGLTTIFFNANPLLRYDGYFILADVVEIPNLGTRANRWWQYLAERFAFGVRQAERPLATRSEQRWFIGYAPLAYVYRLFVSLTIAWLVAQQFLLIGVVIALWAVGLGVVWPLTKGLWALATAARFAGRGGRIVGALGGAVLAVGAGLFVLPWPHHTVTEGVLWLPERAILRAGSDGFVHQVLHRPGAMLAPGDAVLEAVAPALSARIESQAARVEEVRAQFDAAWGSAAVARAQQLEQDLAREAGTLARLRDDAARLTLRSPVAGELLLDRADDLPGRWVRQGEVMGYLRTGEPPLVRLVLPQGDVDLVRLSTLAVTVRPAQDLSLVWPATLKRSTPAAARQLPSAALGALGGGPVVTDPRDEKGLTTVESVFDFELELPPDVPDRFLGSRVHVRFEHPPEPLGWRAWRSLRRAFLSTFNL